MLVFPRLVFPWRQVMNVKRITVAAVLSLLALQVSACAETKNAAVAPQSPAPASVAANNANANAKGSAGAPQGADASVETPGLHVSDAIARACGLPKQQVAPSFQFDSAA